MHIVYISREYPPSLRCGGIGTYVRNVALAMHDLGHDVTVICASDDTRLYDKYDDCGIHVIRLSGGDFVIPSVEDTSLWRKLRMFYRFYSYRKKILKEVRQLEVADIIEIPEYGAEGLFADKFGIPYVVRLHAPMLLDIKSLQPRTYSCMQLPWFWLARAEMSVLNNATYITSCSHHLKQWMYRWQGLSKKNICVIPNFVDGEAWTVENANRSNRHVLYFGTISETKGVVDLINAMRIVRKRLDCSLVLAGRGGAGIKEQFATEEWCQFLGPVSHEKLRSILSQTRVVCLPSWWENFPMAYLEAMAAGCIVVGCSCGGVLEIISHGKNGFLVPSKSPEMLANQIIQVLQMEKKDLQRISQSAVLSVRQFFSKAIVSKQIESYYKKVIADFEL